MLSSVITERGHGRLAGRLAEVFDTDIGFVERLRDDIEDLGP